MTVNPTLVQTAAILCGLLALLFGWMRWRHADPGSGWFALGFLLVFTIFAVDLRAPPEQQEVHRGASLLGALGVVCLGLGLVDYVGTALRRPWRWRAALVAPVVIGLLWLAIAPLPRATAHAFLGSSLAIQAVMVLQVSRREPGAGLRLIAAALLLHPLCLIVLLAARADVYQLRYLLVLPIGVLGMALFAISLARARQRIEAELAAREQAQRALQELNESLEQRVAHRTEELRGVAAGLESFNRSVSHDLRGPLGGMAALTRLAIEMLSIGEQARATEMLEAVVKQADVLAQLVQDLLTLARVSDVPLAREPVDLRQSVTEAAEQLRLAGHATEAVEVASLGLVDADPGLLRQVFVNLVGNALKFSRGAARPVVTVELVKQPGRVVVAIRDNGVGFDPARAAELFEPFRRLHGGAYEGSGVGLTIVRRIVERHGGSVWADGRPGGGAAFYVALPSSQGGPWPTGRLFRPH